MRKTVTMYGVVLALALTGAYLSWTWDDSSAATDESAVTIVEAEPGELQSVTYKEDDLEVKLEPKSDELGTFVLATTTRTKRAAPKKTPSSKPHVHDGDAGHAGHVAGHDTGDAGHAGHDAGGNDVADEAPPEPVETTERLTFKADSDGEEIVEDLAPFRAIRQLEGASKERWEAFGLAEPRGTLTLTYEDGRSHTFEVGGEGYGHRNVYIRDTSNDAIYLIDASTVRPLRYADTRMPEKRPIPWGANKIETIEIVGGTERITAVHKNPDDRAKSTWVPKESEETNVPLETWVETFLRIRGSGYASENEAGELDKTLSVRAVSKGETVTVDLLRGQTPQGDPRWYVRSEFTRGLMKIPTPIGADLSSDFPTVVDAVQSD